MSEVQIPEGVTAEQLLVALEAKKNAGQIPNDFNERIVALAEDDVRPDVKQALADADGSVIADQPDKPAKRPELSPENAEAQALLSTLETRLAEEPQGYKRPEGVNFTEVKTALEARPDLMYSLAQMENSGGEVDIRAVEGNEFVFCDFAKETSEKRRNLTYYQVQKIAEDWSVDIQSKEGWRALQKLGAFDTESWWICVKSDDIIDTGFARFATRFGDSLFVRNYFSPDYHDPRMGWRASLRVPKVA